MLLIASIVAALVAFASAAPSGGNASDAAPEVDFVDIGANLTDDIISQLRAIARQYVGSLNDDFKAGKIQWEAAYNEQFASMLPEQLKYLQGTINPPVTNGSDAEDQQPCAHSAAIPPDLPASFDTRTQWPQCTPFTGYIYDQSTCGSCWAVASAAVITDRHCIAAAKQGRTLDAGQASNWASSADILSCSGGAAGRNGCVGGYMTSGFSYAASRGVMTGYPNYNARLTSSAGCKPYPFPPMAQAGDRQFQSPRCTGSYCSNTYSSDYSRIRLSRSSSLYGGYSYQAQMMSEIYANGPIAAAFTVYSDLYYYSSGVYSRSARGRSQGSHAVRIVGWGVDAYSRLPYWLVMNSWGARWGSAGTFKMRRGTNECGIESQVAFGQALAIEAADRAEPIEEDKAANLLGSDD